MADNPTQDFSQVAIPGLYNNIYYAIWQSLSKIQTSTLVKVMNCSNSGGLSPVGTVDVLPLVNQVDAANNAIEHETIYVIPYFRLQGGANAVIIDPAVGDIGICVFSNKDISNVKETKAQANPASARQFDYCDGLYLGGFLNGVPSQYIIFGSGITIHSPTSITLSSPSIIHNGTTTLNGPLAQNAGEGGGAASIVGPVTVTGSLTANGVSVSGHHHGGVQSGSDSTGTPY